jgi:hypothetical protein
METVRRSRMKMAAAMVPAAEMMPVTSATMTAAVVTAAVTTTVATAVATAMPAFRNREVRHAQRRREDNGSDSQRDL